MLSLSTALRLLFLLPLAVASEHRPSSLLITSASSPAPGSDCIHAGYYGTYGSSREAIYLPSSECEADGLIPLSGLSPAHSLFWVGHAGVLAVGRPDVRDEWPGILQRALASKPYATLVAGRQTVFEAGGIQPKLLYGSESMMLISIDSYMVPSFSSYLPPHLVLVRLPSRPVALEWDKVPEHQVAFLADLTKNLTFDARIDTLVESLDEDEIRQDVRWLTGEGSSGILSRHSFTEGAHRAATWIFAQASSHGARCSLHVFKAGFSPNVICHYEPADPDPARQHAVIVSAHYDSRGSFGSTRAPGGNDDGSGSGHLLAIARAIAKGKIAFHSRVTLAWFAGEEQGLYGSHAYAAKLRESKTEVALQIQADMLGYHAPGEPLQLALPESIGLPEAGYLLGNLSRIYSPELVVGTTPACCSDHQNFVANGFPATAVFERNGDIADPEYHSSGDVSQRQGYDFSQIKSIAKVTFAALLEVAGFVGETK